MLYKSKCTQWQVDLLISFMLQIIQFFHGFNTKNANLSLFVKQYHSSLVFISAFIVCHPAVFAH